MTVEGKSHAPKSDPTKKALHLQLSPHTIRLIDRYAAEHDLYRNRAAEILMTIGAEAAAEDQRGLSARADERPQPLIHASTARKKRRTLLAA